MPKLVEVFAAATLVVVMLAIIAVAVSAKPHGVGQGISGSVVRFRAATPRAARAT